MQEFSFVRVINGLLQNLSVLSILLIVTVELENIFFIYLITEFAKTIVRDLFYYSARTSKTKSYKEKFIKLILKSQTNYKKIIMQ